MSLGQSSSVEIDHPILIAVVLWVAMSFCMGAVGRYVTEPSLYAPAACAVVGGFAVLFGWINRRLFPTTSQMSRAKKWEMALLCCGPGLAYLGLLVGARACSERLGFDGELLTPWIRPPIEWQSTSGQPSTSVGTVLMLLAFGWILTPLLEESLFRGYLLRSLARQRSPWFAIAVSSALFAVAHGRSFAAYAFFGVMLSLIILRGAPLWVVIVAHGFCNLLVSLNEWTLHLGMIDNALDRQPSIPWGMQALIGMALVAVGLGAQAVGLRRLPKVARWMAAEARPPGKEVS
ncbi:MAG: CPBP family intramembrane metalloprotease [Xanthomonadales bacterium]|nr:CPBP family intramembrane metalloprotease [Xanthomonadales bacterium]